MLCGYGVDMSEHVHVSHERSEETPEAKVRWFRGLRMADRMRVLCEVTDLALSVNPALQEKKRVEPAPGRIQVISAT